MWLGSTGRHGSLHLWINVVWQLNCVINRQHMLHLSTLSPYQSFTMRYTNLRLLYACTMAGRPHRQCQMHCMRFVINSIGGIRSASAEQLLIWGKAARKEGCWPRDRQLASGHARSTYKRASHARHKHFSLIEIRVLRRAIMSIHV